MASKWLHKIISIGPFHTRKSATPHLPIAYLCRGSSDATRRTRRSGRKAVRQHPGPGRGQPGDRGRRHLRPAGAERRRQDHADPRPGDAAAAGRRHRDRGRHRRGARPGGGPQPHRPGRPVRRRGRVPDRPRGGGNGRAAVRARLEARRGGTHHPARPGGSGLPGGRGAHARRRRHHAHRHRPAPPDARRCVHRADRARHRACGSR